MNKYLNIAESRNSEAQYPVMVLPQDWEFDCALREIDMERQE